MGSSTAGAMIDFMIAASGVYVIVNYVRMKMSGKVIGGMMLPKGLEPERCKDVQGFLKAVGVKQVLFGVLAILCGWIGLVQDFSGQSLFAVYFCSIAAFLICAVVYARAVKQAVGRFWK